MTQSDSDEGLIFSYNGGNPESLKKLIEKYTPSIYNFIVRLAGQGNAADLVQETFIKVWKNLLKFNAQKASFKTWIFTIAKNTALDFLRKKKSFNFSDLENNDEDNDVSFAESIPDRELLISEAIEKLEDVEFLNKALEKLPPAYQAVLALHYQEEMTFTEIGKVLGKPLNTVKSQHRRALTMLRQIV
jgi:RNA polymerase sigma-70 factor (ECF subfamily)